MTEQDPMWSYGSSKVIETGDYWSYGWNVTFDEKEAAPTGAIMNQFQRGNLGADLYNGALQ